MSKNILVTGAGGGMCQGLNARLAAQGHTIIAVDLSLEAAVRAADTIRAAGGNAMPFRCDVSQAEDVHQLADNVAASAGSVDVLINAAGVLDRKYLSDHDDSSFERVLGINLVGPFRMIQAFSPGMVERGWGRIINISSIAGTTGYPYPSYAASKAGLSNLTRSLVIDFWGTGVTVNSICPGVVDTPMVVEAVRERVRHKVPTEEVVSPDEIGAAAAYLMSDEAKNINGLDLVIDGGATQFFSIFERE